MNHKRRIANKSRKSINSSNSRSSSISSNESSCFWYPILYCWSTLKGLVKALCRYCGSSAFPYSCLHGLRTLFKRLLGGLTVYCRKGCITGTRYLVEPNYHYTERIFWAICLLCSILLGIAVMWQYLNTYTDNVFRVVVEDRDVNKPIQFPAPGICEIGDLNNENVGLIKFYKNVTSGYSQFTDKVDKDLLKALRVMAYHALHEPHQLAKLFNSSLSTIYAEIFERTDFEKFAKEVRSSCEDLMLECIWLKKPFDCCTYFRPIKTMAGTCYLMNSWQTANGPSLNLSITKTQEKPSLFLSFRRNAKVALLNPTDIPEKLTTEFNYNHYDLANGHLAFTFRPMVTDAELFFYNLNVTNCYEGNEKHMDWNKLVNFTYNYASHTSCLSDCIRYMQYEACGCISYIFNKAYGVNYCDLKGYLCLEEKSIFDILSIHSLKDTICQQCLQACNSDVITVISFDRKFSVDSPRSTTFTMLSFPRKQLHRQVIRGDLDVLVSLGGILSLFIGISVVGMLEFLFIVIRAMIYPQH